jgi:hypothetical protein
MKMIKYIAPLAAIVILAAGCSREKWDVPAPGQLVDLTPTMTIKDLKALYANGPTTVSQNAVISGRVCSSDASGNIYKSLYIQDETGGIEIKVGKTELSSIYKPSQRISLKAQNLCLGAYGGMVGIGMPDPTGKYQTSYLDVQSLINEVIIKGSMPSAPEDYITPKPITDISQLNSAAECTLVELQGATYEGLDYCAFYDATGTRIPVDTVSTWALPAYKKGHVYTDKNGEEQVLTIDIPASYASHEFTLNGKTVVIRTSGYANFAGQRVENRAPKGAPMNITAIYTVYNNTKQLLLNSVEDVKPISNAN